MRIIRFILGMILSPLVAPFLFFMTIGHHSEKMIPLTLEYVKLSYIYTTGLGLPILAILHWFNRLTVFYCITIAFFLGAVAGCTYAANLYRPQGYFSTFVLFALLGGLASLFVSIVFCALAGVPRSVNKLRMLG